MTLAKYLVKLMTNCSDNIFDKSKLHSSKKLGEHKLKQSEIVIHLIVLFFVYHVGLTMQPEITVCKNGILTN